MGRAGDDHAGRDLRDPLQEGDGTGHDLLRGIGRQTGIVPTQRLRVLDGGRLAQTRELRVDRRVDVDPAMTENDRRERLDRRRLSPVGQPVDDCPGPQHLGVDERAVQVEEEGRRPHLSFPQHFLYFFPLPHGQGSFRPIFGSSRR